MQTHDSNVRPFVRDESDNQRNPLLSAHEQAHIDAVRAQWSDQQVYNQPTPHHQPENALQALGALLASADWMKVYQYATNTGALGFLGFYAFDFANIAADGNHIYTVYRLFPVLTSTGIVFSMWTLPKESLLRVFYLVGDFTVSWLV